MDKIQDNYNLEITKILNSELSKEEKKNLLMQYHENDIAQILDELNDEERKVIYEILGDEYFGEVLLYTEDIEEIVEDLEPEVIADIIETMDADDAVDILDELDEQTRKEVVELIEDEEVAEDIKTISGYDEDVIGRQMTNNYITVTTKDTIKSAMKTVVGQASENDNVSYIYVLDENEVYYGVIELRDLIIARANDQLDSIVKKNYPYFIDTDKVEEKIAEIRDYGLDSYPVINSQGNLVGVITHDDILEATYEEFEEDYAKLAGITEEEDLNESVFKSIKKRLPWLIVLLVLGLLQSFLMTGFEVVVSALPIIVFFQTLVLGMSGNTGTQSLAVTIRNISNSNMDKKQVFKLLFKELRVGFCNGLMLGLLAGAFVFVFLWITNQGVTSETFVLLEAFKASLIVGSSLIISMTLSSMVGALIPIFFKKIRIDPAVASGPFITTVNDLTSLVVYYLLSAILFSVML